jgi:NAD(P)-dependent dehydrogenase (short-subunit alcohol dehydrogenase family)
MNPNADRVALVTGAARGIGAACAAMLAAKGHPVVLADVIPEVAATAAALPNARAIHLDVADPAAVAGALPTALRRVDGKVSDGVVVLNDWQRASQFLALWWAAPHAAALCARWDALREDPRLAQVIPRSTDAVPVDPDEDVADGGFDRAS